MSGTGPDPEDSGTPGDGPRSPGEGPRSPGGGPWADGPWADGPWVDDARRVLRLVRSTLDEAARPGGPLEQGLALLRQAGPELLDEVADLASGLAATLRAEAGRTSSPSRPETPTSEEPQDPDRSGVDTPAVPGRPPSTVRIDVTG